MAVIGEWPVIDSPSYLRHKQNRICRVLLKVNPIKFNIFFFSVLKAINEDSPTVPTLLTDYILKVLCPT